MERAERRRGMRVEDVAMYNVSRLGDLIILRT